jgi:hypothetical protein
VVGVVSKRVSLDPSHIANVAELDFAAAGDPAVANCFVQHNHSSGVAGTVADTGVVFAAGADVVSGAVVAMDAVAKVVVVHIYHAAVTAAVDSVYSAHMASAVSVEGQVRSPTVLGPEKQ